MSSTRCYKQGNKINLLFAFQLWFHGCPWLLVCVDSHRGIQSSGKNPDLEKYQISTLLRAHVIAITVLPAGSSWHIWLSKSITTWCCVIKRWLLHPQNNPCLQGNSLGTASEGCPGSEFPFCRQVNSSCLPEGFAWVTFKQGVLTTCKSVWNGQYQLCVQ